MVKKEKMFRKKTSAHQGTLVVNLFFSFFLFFSLLLCFVIIIVIKYLCCLCLMIYIVPIFCFDFRFFFLGKKSEGKMEKIISLGS